MFIDYATNEYGTTVSEHRCETCGETFTVCPSSGDDGPRRDADRDGNCLTEDCASYDPTRDASIYFRAGMVYRDGCSEPVDFVDDEEPDIL